MSVRKTLYYNCLEVFSFTNIYASSQQVLQSFDIVGKASWFPYYAASTPRNGHASIRPK